MTFKQDVALGSVLLLCLVYLRSAGAGACCGQQAPGPSLLPHAMHLLAGLWPQLIRGRLVALLPLLTAVNCSSTCRVSESEVHCSRY